MFYGCNSLTSLNISHFDISNANYIDNMFNGCSSLYFLDISNFNCNNLSNFKDMFKGRTNLSYINMKNFIEYNSNETIYNYLFNTTKNNSKIYIKKKQSQVITELVNEIGCTILNIGEDLYRLKKGYDI